MKETSSTMENFLGSQLIVGILSLSMQNEGTFTYHIQLLDNEKVIEEKVSHQFKKLELVEVHKL